jgi:hypothetical protein
MPFIRSFAFKRRAYIIAVILLFSEIMLTCSHYTEKGLVYIVIITPSNHQPSFYAKYTKLNIYLSCNIKLVSKDKCLYSPTHLIIL